MRSFFIMIQMVASFALVAAVVLHSAKGEGLGGIGGQARLFGGQKGMEEGLNKITWGIAIVWIGVALALAIGLDAKIGTLLGL